MTPRLLALLALSGCAAASHSVDPALEGDRLAWANALFASRPTTVVLEDRTRHDATALRLEADTTTWIDPATQDLVSVPTSSVLEVERRDAGRAGNRIVVRGAVTGASVGGAAGAVAGYQSDGCLSFSCGPPSAIARLTFGAVVGVSGAVVGAIGGATGGIVTGWFSPKTERFEVAPSSTTARTPVYE
ncbi:hypothetical protein [Rubrivirga sp.]|uniref:hypothetical protein n=1 Tax=Rubrivirga sp. TaxID=1885344 RepID=UPI003C708F94